MFIRNNDTTFHLFCKIYYYAATAAPQIPLKIKYFFFGHIDHIISHICLLYSDSFIQCPLANNIQFASLTWKMILNTFTKRIRYSSMSITFGSLDLSKFLKQPSYFCALLCDDIWPMTRREMGKNQNVT